MRSSCRNIEDWDGDQASEMEDTPARNYASEWGVEAVVADFALAWKTAAVGGEHWPVSERVVVLPMKIVMFA
ncbi:hypothetical protein L1887_03392 [Cichorium endivia]|nr:hypothetical protein L1887_03392 [Cichorium endivia]